MKRIEFEYLTTQAAQSGVDWCQAWCDSKSQQALQLDDISISWENTKHRFFGCLSFPWIYMKRGKSRNLSSSLFGFSSCWANRIDWIAVRLAKCHGFGGLIRVNFLEVWGKFVESVISVFDVWVRGAMSHQIRSFFEHCSKSLWPPPPPSFWTSCCKFFLMDFLNSA